MNNMNMTNCPFAVQIQNRHCGALAALSAACRTLFKQAFKPMGSFSSGCPSQA
jgi:hypothetical protein